MHPSGKRLRPGTIKAASVIRWGKLPRSITLPSGAPINGKIMEAPVDSCYLGFLALRYQVKTVPVNAGSLHNAGKKVLHKKGQQVEPLFHELQEPFIDYNTMPG